jgi:hypothetical protein
VISVNDSGWLTVTKQGRVVVIERITEESQYRALLLAGVSAAIAAAAAKGLITVDYKKGK